MSEEISHNALAARIDSVQREVTEFKDDSKQYRDRQRLRMDQIHGDTQEIKKYVIEQRANTRTIRAGCKVIAAILAAGAAIVAIVKGIQPPHRP